MNKSILMMGIVVMVAPVTCVHACAATGNAGG